MPHNESLKMFRNEIEIVIKIAAPFITQASSPGEYGLDAVVSRNADGVIMIPGSHIEGKLRKAWEELRSGLGAEDLQTFVPTEENIEKWLGTPSSEEGYLPKSKRLFFSDFLLTNGEPPAQTGYRIKIDPIRQAADHGALAAVECPFPSGAAMDFLGRVRFETRTMEEADRIAGQVKCGLEFIAQLGGFRSTGNGRVKNVCFRRTDFKPIEVKARQWNGESGFDFIIIPEEPFCIAQKPNAGNIFESTTEIPGGVIRGCIARSLNRLLGNAEQNEIEELEEETGFDELGKNFSRIRVSHAFPGQAWLVRPVRPPLSLVKSGGLHDAALLGRPCLINGMAPAFDIDWKDDSDVKKLFGWPTLQRELRVRTAMDPEKLTSLRDEEGGKLFAYEMVVPEGRGWLGRVDIGEIEAESREAVLNQLASLLEQAGILGLGKSKIAARVVVMPEGAIKNAHETCRFSPLTGCECNLAITLQTPALLLNPDPLAENHDSDTLYKQYRASWESLSSNLKLVRFFARQRLSGGAYQYNRFQKNKTYRPWLLTEAGSVFVFSIEDGENIKQEVEQWLRRGLEIPEPVKKAYGLGDGADLWRHCPFIAENGYGEIAVNLEIHESRVPPPEICEPIDSIEELFHQQEVSS